MNAEILKAAGIDYDQGVKRFVGKAQLFEKALAKFSRDTTFSRLKAAFESGDAEQMFAAAHELKGMCGNIALTSLFDRSDAVVKLLRGGANTSAEVADAYGDLEMEYAKVYDGILTAMEENL